MSNTIGPTAVKFNPVAKGTADAVFTSVDVIVGKATKDGQIDLELLKVLASDQPVGDVKDALTRLIEAFSEVKVEYVQTGSKTEAKYSYKKYQGLYDLNPELHSERFEGYVERPIIKEVKQKVLLITSLPVELYREIANDSRLRAAKIFGDDAIFDEADFDGWKLPDNDKAGALLKGALGELFRAIGTFNRELKAEAEAVAFENGVANLKNQFELFAKEVAPFAAQYADSPDTARVLAKALVYEVAGRTLFRNVEETTRSMGYRRQNLQNEPEAKFKELDSNPFAKMGLAKVKLDAKETLKFIQTYPASVFYTTEGGKLDTKKAEFKSLADFEAQLPNLVLNRFPPMTFGEFWTGAAQR